MARYLSICLLTLVSLSLAACENRGDTVLSGAPSFGDPYSIAMGPTPDSPDEPPAIEGDSLFLSVQYAGGCRDHDFQLGYRSRRDTTELWIGHDANGDDCEALMFERLSFRLPEGAVNAETVILLDPENDFPHLVGR